MALSSDRTERRPDERRRYRVSLRALLVGVAVAAVVFGLIRHEVRRRIFRSQQVAILREQSGLTDAVLRQARKTQWLQRHTDGTDRWYDGTGGGHSDSSRWHRKVRRRITGPDLPPELGIEIRVEGALEGGQVGRILIRDLGGKYNAPLIDELTKGYAKRNWDYQILWVDGTVETWSKETSSMGAAK